MCDVCGKAAEELRTFLKDLEDKYPGTTVDGVEVPRDHHVSIAVYVANERYMDEMRADVIKQLMGEEEPLPSALLPRGGTQKERLH